MEALGKAVEPETYKKPFNKLPKPKPNDYEGDGYPNNHHPWIQN